MMSSQRSSSDVSMHCDHVMFRDILEGHDQVSSKMHFETEIKCTQRCTWRR